jgi:hypothetical protein
MRTFYKEVNMEYINAWLENFERQSLIRRALIVSGNIIDLSFSATGQLQPINQIITETLKKQEDTLKVQAEVEPLRALANQLSALKKNGKDSLPNFVRNVKLAMFHKAKKIVITK